MDSIGKNRRKNGPLIVVPGSHKFDLIDYSLFGLKTPTSITRTYQNFIKL
jgi:ectoine hydroxylase-related dioxygenase (phytanoyl-CoA dioxygenase family)